ncbi:MAG: FeoB-associated Cys-rich membrane protein [Clostridia bacterium]|nr:FeoB-associated Cys-rich membrane protein [Clostridia bacterium]
MIDILIVVLAGAIVVGTIVKSVKDKKENKGCGNCCGCAHSKNCQSKKEK